MTIICCCKDWSPAGTGSIDRPTIPHGSYKANGEGLPAIDSSTEASYFTGAFPTLFPYGVGGHLGDARGNRPQKVTLQDFTKYAMLSLVAQYFHTMIAAFVNSFVKCLSKEPEIFSTTSSIVV
jgi:hypothetical protein